MMLRADSLVSGDLMKAHLRNSMTPKPLMSHLSREALPQLENYNSQDSVTTRPTFDELYLGETPKNKVIN